MRVTDIDDVKKIDGGINRSLGRQKEKQKVTFLKKDIKTE